MDTDVSTLKKPKFLNKYLSSERKNNFADETSAMEVKAPNLKTFSPMK